MTNLYFSISTTVQGTSSAPFGMNFSSGLNGLYGFIANIFMPAVGALFVILAVVTLAQGNDDPEKYIIAAMSSVMIGGLVALLQTFTSNGNPGTALTTLIGYVGNVIMPIYGAWCIIKGVLVHGGLFNRTFISDNFMRYYIAGFASFMIAGICKLIDYFVAGH